MKTSICLLLSVLVIGAQARPARNCTNAAPGGACRATAAGPVVLSADETKALVFQVEEERMAGELYTALAAKWDLRQFRNIRQAEARHEATLRQLAQSAGVTLPETTPGKFADPVLQQRYDTLLARGLTSSTEALAVGVAVETQDIADLNTLAAATKSEALKTVVTNLTRASEHHLAAFSGETGRGKHARAETRGRGNRNGNGRGACVQAGCRANT